MAKQADLPGAFEQLVMLALVRLGGSAYGMTVRRALEERTGRSVSLGAVYATLDRLEAKGHTASRAAVGTEEREGRAKQFFRVFVLPSQHSEELVGDLIEEARTFIAPAYRRTTNERRLSGWYPVAVRFEYHQNTTASRPGASRFSEEKRIV